MRVDRTNARDRASGSDPAPRQKSAGGATPASAAKMKLTERPGRKRSLRMKGRFPRRDGWCSTGGGGEGEEGVAIIRESASAVGKLGSGTLRLESHRTLFTLDNSTVKYREKTSAGESAPLRAEAIDFWLPSLRSLHPLPSPPTPSVFRIFRRRWITRSN